VFDDGGNDVEGCTDMGACNYDSDATVDDGSCEYAEENYDCEGNCVAEIDCSGQCGGDAVVDDCCECDDNALNDCYDHLNIPLHAGANLISFPALPDDVSVESIFDGTDGVIGEGVGAVYLDEWGWIGSLTSVRQDDGYWVKVSEDTTLELINCEPVNYDADGIVIYEIHSGNNLISYPFYNDQGLEAGLGNAIADVYALAGEGVAALKIGNSFVGSLEAFEGGKGYWLVATADFEFTYRLFMYKCI
jgi:hypothetical protein